MKLNIVKTGIAFGFAILTGSISSQAQERREHDQKPPSIEQLMKDLDANEDGKLSLAEVKGPLKDDFTKIDLNKDGFLTIEELEKAPKPKRGRKEK
ncbi:EF-hand domain-containing protein [Flavobacteriaceae bacterium F08102]|nr:EF-hand domain-containing protein [Flavobacteriaceae bacterium F08102]